MQTTIITSPKGTIAPETALAEDRAEERGAEPEIREIVIRPVAGWRAIDLGELVAYRDLFFFLTWRSIKVQYAQSALGVGWALIQPLFQTLVFTIVFGYLAKVKSDGGPYSLFSLVALIPWTYFSNAVTTGADSLVNNVRLLTKVYFPRLVMPLSAVMAKLVDFAIAMAMLCVMLMIYRQPPTWNVIWLPLLILLMVLTATGLGTWLTALAIQYRDVKYALNFVMQLVMYAAPVIYSTYALPEWYDLGQHVPSLGGWEIPVRHVYALNPMVGVIEGFRAAFLGQHAMPWDLIGIGAISAGVIAFTGCVYFRSREKLFADVA